jgi:hypothetical protein
LIGPHYNPMYIQVVSIALHSFSRSRLICGPQGGVHRVIIQAGRQTEFDRRRATWTDESLNRGGFTQRWCLLTRNCSMRRQTTMPMAETCYWQSGYRQLPAHAWRHRETWETERGGDVAATEWVFSARSYPGVMARACFVSTLVGQWWTCRYHHVCFEVSVLEIAERKKKTFYLLVPLPSSEYFASQTRTGGNRLFRLLCSNRIYEKDFFNCCLTCWHFLTPVQ